MPLPRAGITLSPFILAGLAVAALGAPPTPAPRSSPTPWNTGTAPPPPAKPAEDSTLSLRIYENVQQSPLPYRPPAPGPGPRGTHNPAWAADVSAVMTRCADGSLIIKALVIGGQLTPLDARCPGEARDNSSGPAPTCDARTWNCTPPPAR